LLRRNGFVDVATRHDLAGRARATGGRWVGEALGRDGVKKT
jgi:hypothetical protein